MKLLHAAKNIHFRSYQRLFLFSTSSPAVYGFPTAKRILKYSYWPFLQFGRVAFVVETARANIEIFRFANVVSGKLHCDMAFVFTSRSHASVLCLASELAKSLSWMGEKYAELNEILFFKLCQINGISLYLQTPFYAEYVYVCILFYRSYAIQ